MKQSISQIKTRWASRYLRQMCKHFGHKVPVEFDDHQGVITLPFGICSLKATNSELSLIVSGDTHRLEPVIAAHLERFAFREGLIVTWVGSACSVCSHTIDSQHKPGTTL